MTDTTAAPTIRAAVLTALNDSIPGSRVHVHRRIVSIEPHVNSVDCWCVPLLLTAGAAYPREAIDAVCREAEGGN